MIRATVTLPAALTAVLAVLPSGSMSEVSAQQSMDDVEITVHLVRGSVYYLEGRGGNIGLSAGDDGIVMIDDQFAPLSDRIVDAIREVSDGEIRYLINTHIHGDHVGGNANFAGMGVDIVARHEVRERLLRSGTEADALPVVTFGDDVVFHLNGQEVSVFGVPPAHTDGDSYIHFRGDDVLHAGDVFRTTGYPYIDTANGGTLEGTLQALAIAIGMSGPETLIVPGHGQVSTREDVQEFRDMIVEVAERVEAMVADGMSYDEVVDAEPTADFDGRYGDPERFLTAVYAELAGEE